MTIVILVTISMSDNEIEYLRMLKEQKFPSGEQLYAEACIRLGGPPPPLAADNIPYGILWSEKVSFSVVDTWFPSILSTILPSMTWKNSYESEK